VVTRTNRRQEAATSRQGRFARGFIGQAQAPSRFRRSREVEQTRAQRLLEGIRGALPGRGRGRKPAMFGVLGAGAAGAAAVVAKRRHGSRSQQSGDEMSSLPDLETSSASASGSAHPADAPEPAEADQGPEKPAPDDRSAEPPRG
jgi:hypothetical protein